MPSHRCYERIPTWEESGADRTEASQERECSEEQDCEQGNDERAALLLAASHHLSPGAASPPADGQATASPLAVGELGPPKVDLSAPPPYSELGTRDSTYVIMENSLFSVNLTGAALQGEQAGVEPPSYEEVQRIKAVEAQLESGDHILLPPHTVPVGDVETSEGGECGRTTATAAAAANEDLLGTDMLFFFSFAAAFLFNWVGFVVLVCFCHSVAGRSGALAGFGLSLAKWALIMRHSAVLPKETNNWLLWLLMLLGVVISMRAVLQYVTAKREWQRASAASRHRFLLFH